jgi:four helix bundle protein
MPTVHVFEELIIWKLAAAQSQCVWTYIKDGCFEMDKPLADQLNRSSGSVMDNIAEGFDRFSRADFRHFLIVARGSNAEVRSQLYRAKSRGHIPQEEAIVMIQDAKKLGIKINNLIKHLDSSMYKSKAKSHSGSGSLSEPEAVYGAEDDANYLPAELFATEGLN